MTFISLSLVGLSYPSNGADLIPVVKWTFGQIVAITGIFGVNFPSFGPILDLENMSWEFLLRRHVSRLNNQSSNRHLLIPKLQSSMGRAIVRVCEAFSP